MDLFLFDYAGVIRAAVNSWDFDMTSNKDAGGAWTEEPFEMSEDVQTEYERGIEDGKARMRSLADDVLARALADELEIEALKARVDDLNRRLRTPELPAAGEVRWPSDGEMLNLLAAAGYDLQSAHPSCYCAFSWKTFTEKLKAALALPQSKDARTPVATVQGQEPDWASLTGNDLTDLIDQKLGRDQGNRALAFGLLNHFDVRPRTAAAPTGVAPVASGGVREALKDAIELLESYSFSRGIDPRNATPESVIGKGRAALAASDRE